MISQSDETHILGFLRACKFSLERTKEKMDNFYAVTCKQQRQIINIYTILYITVLNGR